MKLLDSSVQIDIFGLIKNYKAIVYSILIFKFKKTKYSSK